MTDLQQRLDSLREQLVSVRASPTPSAISALERTARELLSDAKNTPFESAAQSLFAEIARIGAGGASSSSATVRGLVRRARIRIEIAGDEDDIDEAIDILAEALAVDASDAEVLALLEQAAAYSGQAAQRVSDLCARYGIKGMLRAVHADDFDAPVLPPVTSSARVPDPVADAGDVPPPPRFVTSAGYVPPEREMGQRPAMPRRPVGMASNADIDALLSEVTQAYYAGEYQLTVDLANRILSQQPGNPTALEYRQKAEDNLIRGVVPDHRIPFEARVAYNRAKSLERAGNYDDAERLYREARDLAERSGIMSWKDAEQAMLDIQDLALAREMLNEGDRLMAADNWGEALRKYEGALRVVPNDPQAESRIEQVRRIISDSDQAAAQLNMLSGTLTEQATQLRNVMAILARVRQALPTSPRVQALYQEANNRLGGIKTQIYDQAQATLTRAGNAISIEDRLTYINDALRMLEVGVELDASDARITALMSEGRAKASELQRARQIIERSSALIAQNFDQEITQARTMLAELLQFAQDDRYRSVVNELFGRYLERAEYAVEEGDLIEAQSWAEAMREDPFRILGRRSEVQRIENAIKRQRRENRIRLAIVVGGLGLIFFFALLFTRDAWSPILFPPPTATPTITPTPSDTPTITPTFTPSHTPTATNTPTDTATPTATFTPSHTPTATSTPTPTFTPTDTPTATLTPSITPTPPVLCQLVATNPDGTRVRANPSTQSPQISVIPSLTPLNVIQQQRDNTNFVWFFVRARVGDATIEGWVREDNTRPLPDSLCPTLPEQ